MLVLTTVGLAFRGWTGNHRCSRLSTTRENPFFDQNDTELVAMSPVTIRYI